MRCLKAEKLLSSYMDGELTNKERGVIEFHIKDCATCYARLADLQGIHNVFIHLERLRAPHGFYARTISRITEKDQKRRLFFPVFTRFVEAVVLIAIIIIGTRTGGFLGNTFMQQKPSLESSLTLDSFEAIPPDSIGAVYIATIEGNNEK